jgi:predicted nuclease of predicted toxin-antitoxin system
MRFLIDAQLPPSLAVTLRECGQEAAHVFDLLPPAARDAVIWQLALDSGYVLVTKDEDFAAWSRLREPAPPLLRRITVGQRKASTW